MFRVLVINPGSTSTKIAVFDDEKEILKETIRHNHADLQQFDKIIDEFNFRVEIIEKTLKAAGIPIDSLKAVVGRGGLLKPIPGGVFAVNEIMLKDLREAQRGEHASNLGAIIAYNIAGTTGIPSFIVDPVVVDEMEDVARLSGHPLLKRISIFHALNQKASARRAAKELKIPYEEGNFIVAHMGGGISIGAHRKGRVIDVNNALNGDGPYSPERSGDLPAGPLVKLCFSGDYTEKEIGKMLKGEGGLKAYLGTADGMEVQNRVKAGDKEAVLVYDGLIYQVAKFIAALSTVLEGKVDGIVLTGGLAYDTYLTSNIGKKVSFIAKVLTYPGEDEMEALRDGALRVLRGEEEPHDYR
ncbi:MAG: butyrate kinase [Spirochaetales bacterium]|jgi:butyrate kinase|nr:butyrate kinase [Spirochaetales bacterium]